MNLSAVLPPIAGVLLALLLPRRRFRPALAGTVVGALGLASLRVAGGPVWQAAGLPVTFLSVTAALLLGGMLIPLAHAGRAAWNGELRGRWLLVLPAAIFALLTSAWVAVPVAAAGGAGATLLALVILIAAALLLSTVARVFRLRERIGRWDRTLFGAYERSAALPCGPAERWLLVVHSGLAVAALAAPHLLVLLGAVFGAAITGVVLDRRLDEAARWPFSMPAGLLLLAAGSAFLIQVAGEVPLTLRELRDGPFSAAFELSASLLFIGAAWPLLELWPLHSRPRGPATPLAGAALLGAVASQILPGGTGHWQPLIFPLLALSSWYAAGTGTVSLALTAVASAGLVSLDERATIAGVGVVALVVVLGVMRRLRPPEGIRRLVTAGVALVSAGAAVPLLEGALRAQTFYTVLVAAGLAATLTGSAWRTSGAATAR